MSPEAERTIAEAAALLRGRRHVVALTGAGLSAESGVPTYRGAGGYSTRFVDPAIDGWDLFCQDPATWWRAVLAPESAESEFAVAIREAEPNAGHLALAEMEAEGLLAHVITQNIDDLHRRAGTRALTEIHGNRLWARCMTCGEREPMARVKLDRLPPLCKGCGGILKSDVVMFGEPIPEAALRECYRQAAACDAFIVAGTSAVVYPAADFPVLAKQRGSVLIEVNPEETALTPLADAAVRLPAGLALTRLLEILRTL